MIINIVNTICKIMFISLLNRGNSPRKFFFNFKMIYVIFFIVLNMSFRNSFM